MGLSPGSLRFRGLIRPSRSRRLWKRRSSPRRLVASMQKRAMARPWSSSLLSKLDQKLYRGPTSPDAARDSRGGIPIAPPLPRTRHPWNPFEKTRQCSGRVACAPSSETQGACARDASAEGGGAYANRKRTSGQGAFTPGRPYSAQRTEEKERR